jgi:Ni/Co efflux regulator RcnB
MKSLIQAVVVAAALAAPVAAFAQSNQPVTRAQVRAELVQLEQTGWRPGEGDRTTYPAQIQVAAENGSTSDVGGAVSGSSESGARAVSAFTGSSSLYRGH